MPKPGSTTQRDYGAHHQRTRKALLHTAVGSTCTRCAVVITAADLVIVGPTGRRRAGVHLDHSDDRLGYAGWAHARCNLSAGATKGNLERAQGDTWQPSEDW